MTPSQYVTRFLKAIFYAKIQRKDELNKHFGKKFKKKGVHKPCGKDGNVTEDKDVF